MIKLPSSGALSNRFFSSTGVFWLIDAVLGLWGDATEAAAAATTSLAVWSPGAEPIIKRLTALAVAFDWAPLWTSLAVLLGSGEAQSLLGALTAAFMPWEPFVAVASFLVSHVVDNRR